MKTLQCAVVAITLFLSPATSIFASHPTSGFSLPDSIGSVSLHYRLVRGLVVLPVTINDSIEVNLILDTGCNNLVLFGKRFQQLFDFPSPRDVVFSGLGEGEPVTGKLAIGNKVSINQVLGHQIPVVVVGSQDIFSPQHRIDGIIGYDIFLRFEVKMDPRSRTITFRPAHKSFAPQGVTRVPLAITDARPIVKSTVYLRKGAPRKVELMIDTGSSFGLLLKTTNMDEFGDQDQERILGRGLNGPLSGYRIVSPKLSIHSLEIEKVSTGIVSSRWHNNASIGMDVLKDYIVILNYQKEYACFISIEDATYSQIL